MIGRIKGGWVHSQPEFPDEECQPQALRQEVESRIGLSASLVNISLVAAIVLSQTAQITELIYEFGRYSALIPVEGVADTHSEQHIS
ncbi:hypothetical protein RB195_018207 [Necator americanus]|uniref:Uncharacterized protein n=1 Tax=Necator americanus TaxID=51031 RepID=A0ABR1C8P3_NECAM